MASGAFLFRSSRLALITQSNVFPPTGISALLNLKVSLTSLLARFLSCDFVLSFFEAVTPNRFIPRSLGSTNTVISRPSKRLPSEYTRRKSAGFRSLSSFVKRNLNNGMGSGACDPSHGDASKRHVRFWSPFLHGIRASWRDGDCWVDKFSLA